MSEERVEAAVLRPERLERLEAWLAAHTDTVALVALGMGVLVRLFLAAHNYLNPDEIIRVFAADRRTLADVIRHDLDNPHPPFLSCLLFFWRLLGRSDFVLRLLPVLLGAGTVWLGYRWVRNALGMRAGLVAVMLMAFSPAMVVLGFEVRPYAPELLAIAAGLYLLERGVRESRPGFILLFGVAQSLAVCSHYSALLFVLATGLYLLARAVTRQLPRRVVLAWLGGEAFTIGVLALLYRFHIARLVGGQREAILKEEYLRALYYSPDKGSVVSFLASRTVDLFRYIAAHPSFVAAWLFLLGFVAGVVLLVVRKPRRTWHAVLLVLPFAVAAAVAALGKYPLGGTRHLSFLMLFGIAGASAAVAGLTGRRFWPLLAGAAVLMPPWLLFGGWMVMGGYVRPLDYGRPRIRAAVRYVRELTPAGGIIFTDLETQLLLKRYLWDGKGPVEVNYPEGMYDFRTPEYRLVSLRDWRFVPPRFNRDFAVMAEAFGVAPGTSVTVVSTEFFYRHMADELAARGIEYPNTRSFGPRISVFTIAVGTEVLDDSSRARSRLVAARLEALLGEAERAMRGRARIALWPGRYLDAGVRQRLARLADRVFSYTEFGDTLRPDADRDVQYLPALAFWFHGTREARPGRMKFLPQAGPYGVRGVRYLPFAGDQDSIAGAYRIEAITPDGLVRLAAQAGTEFAGRVGLVLWPTRYRWLLEQSPLSASAYRVVGYREVAEWFRLREPRFDAMLPALAFWEFLNQEERPEFMSYMDEAEDYISAGYRFTLLALDQEHNLGLYLVDRAARP